MAPRLGRIRSLAFCSLVALSVLPLLFGCGAPAAPAAAPTKAPEATKPAAAAPTAAPQAAQSTAAPQAAQPTAGPKAATPAPTAAPAAGAIPALPKVSGFPTKPIQVIVPLAAGGGADLGTRILMSQMEKEVGSIQVVNKPGAGQQVGLTELATSKPDGYTIGITVLPTAITVYLDPKRKAVFSMKDFLPLARHVTDTMGIMVKADSPYTDLKSLVDDAKARPGKVKVGSTGLLTANHLALIQLENLTGAKFAIVQFEGGGAEDITSLMGGNTDASCSATGTWVKQVQEGQLRSLGVFDDKRLKYLPNVKTAEEQGYKVYMGVTRGYSMPKGATPEIANYLQIALQRSIMNDSVIQKMDESNLGTSYMNSADYAKYWQEMEISTAKIMQEVGAQ